MLRAKHVSGAGYLVCSSVGFLIAVLLRFLVKRYFHLLGLQGLELSIFLLFQIFIAGHLAHRFTRWAFEGSGC